MQRSNCLFGIYGNLDRLEVRFWVKSVDPVQSGPGRFCFNDYGYLFPFHSLYYIPFSVATIPSISMSMYTNPCTYIGRLVLYCFTISRSNYISRASYISSSWRYFSSQALPNNELKNHRNDDIRSRIIGLVFPRRSATLVLQNWVDEGNNVSVSELRRISKQLLKYRRYKHALEV